MNVFVQLVWIALIKLYFLQFKFSSKDASCGVWPIQIHCLNWISFRNSVLIPTLVSSLEVFMFTDPSVQGSECLIHSPNTQCYLGYHKLDHFSDSFLLLSKVQNNFSKPPLVLSRCIFEQTWMRLCILSWRALITAGRPRAARNLLRCGQTVISPVHPSWNSPDQREKSVDGGRWIEIEGKGRKGYSVFALPPKKVYFRSHGDAPRDSTWHLT